MFLKHIKYLIVSTYLNYPEVVFGKPEYTLRGLTPFVPLDTLTPSLTMWGVVHVLCQQKGWVGVFPFSDTF